MTLGGGRLEATGCEEWGAEEGGGRPEEVWGESGGSGVKKEKQRQKEGKLRIAGDLDREQFSKKG